MNERLTKLEDDLEAARRCARLAQDAHDIVCARVAKLEAALKEIAERRFFAETMIEIARAALKDAPL